MTSGNRYCRRCGTIFQAPLEYCPACEAMWDQPLRPSDVATIADILQALDDWRLEGLLDEESHRRLHDTFRARIDELGTPRRQPAAPTRAAAAAAAEPTARNAQPNLGRWAAARQADIVLYLGAFLLVVAALIFVRGRGEAVPPALRVSLLFSYTAVFTVMGGLLRRWQRIREAGPVFLAIGALLTPLNFVLIHEELLEQREVSGESVWLLGSIYSVAFYGALGARGYGRMYTLLAAIAAVSAWAALSARLGIPDEWTGAWWMLLGGAVVVAALGRAARRLPLAITAGALMALSLLVAHAFAGDVHRWQLPTTYFLLSAALSLVGIRLRAGIALLPAALAATAAAVASLWAAGFDETWYAYPALLTGALAVTTRPLWAHSSHALAASGWAVAAGAGAAPALLAVAAHFEGWHGAAAFVMGAGVLAGAAWQDRTHGFLRWLDEIANPGGAADPSTQALERVAFGWAAFGTWLGAVAHTHRVLDLKTPETLWAYAATAALVLPALAWSARRDARATPVLAPLSLAAIALALPPEAYAGHRAFLLGGFGLAFAAVARLSRRWSTGPLAFLLGTASPANGWDALNWATWTLATTYGVAAALLFIALAPWRTYGSRGTHPMEREVSVPLITWGAALAGPIAALAAMLDRVNRTGEVATDTIEYATLVALAALAAALVAVEGRRLRQWDVEVLALLLGGIAAGAAWPALHWATWTLAVFYAAAGAGLFTALASRRSYAKDANGAVQVLSWLGPAAAGFAAALALNERVSKDEIARAVSVELVEYRALVGVVLLIAVLIAAEGWRLKAPWAYVPASATAMVALVMAIAIARPDNVQAYTVPVGLYLASVGLVVGRSPMLLPPHLALHEAVTAAGTALLVLPQAEQGFEPGGEVWALIILVEGAAFLAAAFMLSARWLAVAGVLAISGVGVRALAVQRDVIPFWLMLGVAGLVLLVVGLLLLFEREAWQRAAAQASDWWLELPARSTLSVPEGAVLSALLPAVAVFVLTTAAN